MTAIMLCVGLAVVSVALVDLGLDSARRVQEEVQRESERQALRTAIAETMADLVNRPESGLGKSSRRYGAIEIEVTAANELTRTNVYHASEETLVEALKPLGGNAAALAAQLVAARSGAGVNQLPLDEFLTGLHLDTSETACIREKLTIHASSIDPFAAPGAAPSSKEGGVVNLRARIVDGRPIDLTREAILVITGDRQTPLLVLDDRQFRTSQIERCSDETS